ncbi:hypothetical protein, partial [Rhodopirellula bahusiensis]
LPACDCADHRLEAYATSFPIAKETKNVQVHGCGTLSGTFTERSDRFAVGEKLADERLIR